MPLLKLLKKVSDKIHVVFMRDIVMYLLYEDTALSYPEVGDFLGGRDHTTIMHGVEKITEDVLASPAVQDVIEKIRSLYPPVTVASADPSS